VIMVCFRQRGGGRPAAASHTPPRCLPRALLLLAVVAVDMPRKWKHRELGRPVKWTGPGPQPGGIFYEQAPTQEAKDEHERAWEAAYWKFREEQARKLPLLAQEYGIDTTSEAWPFRLLLLLAEKVAPGFRVNWGRHHGPQPTWTDSTWAELRADI